MLLVVQGLIDRCAWTSVAGGGRVCTERGGEDFWLIKQCMSIKVLSVLETNKDLLTFCHKPVHYTFS